MTTVRNRITTAAGASTTGWVIARLVGPSFREATQTEAIAEHQVQTAPGGSWSLDLEPNTVEAPYYVIAEQAADFRTVQHVVAVPDADAVWLGDITVQVPLPVGSALAVYGGPPGPVGPAGPPWTGTQQEFADAVGTAAAASPAVRAASQTVVAEAAADPASALRTTLRTTFDPTYAATSVIATPQRVDEVRRGKFGKVGTAGKAVISLRFDHQLDPFIATVLPLLTARNLPFSIGLVTGSIGNSSAAYEPTNATWADVKNKIQAVGGEVWAHSRTHSDGVSLASEIVGSKADIEAQGLKVMGWQQPGGPSTYGLPHTGVELMNDPAGRLIRETYGLYETSIAGSSRRSLPTDGCWGHNHITIDTRNATTVKGYIDEAVALGSGIQLMLHPLQVGVSGFISLADLTSVLDYLVALRDAGKLEVLTGSALAFADPGSTRRPSLMPFGDFEGIATSPIPAPWATSGANWVIKTDGGRTGSNYLQIPATGGLALCETLVGEYGMDGHAFMFEGWIRSSATSTTTWRAGLTALIGTSNVSVRSISGTVTQDAGWVRVRMPVVIPVGTSLAKFFVGRLGGGATDWDDCSVVAI